MASGTATITGKIGPGLTVTSAVYSGISRFGFDIENCRLYMVFNDGRPITYVDIAAQTTVTVTLSGAAGNYTIAVS